VAQTYTYSVSADCPSGQVHVGNLRADILASAISSAVLQDIMRDGDVLSIIFDVALSAGDKTILDGDTLAPAGGLIAAHSLTNVTYTELPLDQVSENPAGEARDQVVPGVIPYLGSFAGWTNRAQIKRNDVFYGRVWLGPGTYIGCDYIVDEIKAGDVMFAVYADDAGTPPRPTGAILASGKEALPLTVSKHRVEFTSSLVVTSAAYYWVAVKPRANDVNVATTSDAYQEAWGDVIFTYKTGYGDIDIGALPVSFDTNADTALPFFSVVLEGAP
jgi:hypothetical protein